MIISVNKDASHEWAGQTIEVPDGIGASMIRRGLATEGHALDTPPAKKSSKRAAKKAPAKKVATPANAETVTES